MGMFDDLVPQAASAKAPAAARGGMFGDLIPDQAQQGQTADVPALDFNRPIEAVRSDIAKIPEGKSRDEAMKAWADHYVAKERANVKAHDTGRLAINPLRLADTIRNIARGAPIAGPFADELNAATSDAIYKVTGAGAPYDESVAYQRATDRALDKESPVQSTVEQLVGGVVGGAPIAKEILGTGTTLVGKTLRGGPLGALYGYVSGFGQGEGDAEKRHEKATSGEGQPLGLSPTILGLGAGTVLPSAITGASHVGGKIAEVVSPMTARVGAVLDNLPRRIGFPMSADGAVPGGVGANAAGSQMIANQLARSGRSVDSLRNALDDVAESGRYNSSGQAQDATALVDLDTGLQRLAGSAARASPEAATTAKNFMFARQTGITPQDGVRTAPGLPTRPMLARPVTAEQSQRALGHDYGAGAGNIVPMGQGERIGDAFKRSLQIKDSDYHGHAGNAHRTDQSIIKAAQDEAKPAYQAVYKAGDNINIAPTIDGVLAKWAADGERLGREALPLVNLVQRFVKLMRPGGNSITHIERFDRTKQYMDGQIERYFDSLSGRNRYIGGVLNEFKNDLLKAVDNIPKGDLGPLYAKARSQFSSRMEAREALQMGRDAWKADSDIGVDAFRSLTGDNAKLFRLGLYDGYEKAAKNMKRGADKTALFDNPRIQELLTEVIPRTKTAGAEFANRPERFGKYVGNEQRAVETRNIVQGGSPTQRNKVDDDAYDIMNRWTEMVESFKTSGSITKLGIDAVGNMLNSLFGMRADTAAAISRQLFTADPAMRARILADVEARLGRDRFGHLMRLMEDYQASIARQAVPDTSQ
jgi:hypothetical protein